MEMQRPTKKSKPNVLKGRAAIDAYKKSISPQGMAAAEAAAKKAIEDKYPGLFIPETKIAPPGRRGR